MIKQIIHSLVISNLIIQCSTKQINLFNFSDFCGTIDVPLNPLLPSSRANIHLGQLAVRISIYYDNSLLLKYNNDVNAVKEFIYRTVSSVELSYRQPKMRRVADFSFEVTKIGLYYEYDMNSEANGNYYRRNFCSHIKRSGSLHNMAASVLLTGHNFRATGSRSSSTQGLAHINIACKWYESQIDPCAIVEGRSFKAAFIMAHELGHILGMNHDEIQHCGSSNIMSTSTGDGKSRWSDCSINQMVAYISSLRKTNDWCFAPNKNTKEVDFPSEYRSTSIDIQCRTVLGPNFHQYITWNKKIDVCHKIVCTDDTIVISIHPAIENSPCTPQMVCRDGKCRPI